MIILDIVINFINNNIIKIIGNIHNIVRGFLDFSMTVLNQAVCDQESVLFLHSQTFFTVISF